VAVNPGFYGQLLEAKCDLYEFNVSKASQSVDGKERFWIQDSVGDLD
jgi:hypothetical protein